MDKLKELVIQRIIKENISTIILVCITGWFAYVNQKMVNVLIESQSVIDRNSNVINKLDENQIRINKEDKEYQKKVLEYHQKELILLNENNEILKLIEPYYNAKQRSN